MPRLISWPAAALVALLSLTGCGGDNSASRGCTLAGCNPGVFLTGLPELTVPDARLVTIEICVEDRCGRTRAPFGEVKQSGIGVDVPIPEHAPGAAVYAEIHDRDGTMLFRAAGHGMVRTIRPNGPDCPPVCRRIAMRVDGESLVSA